MGGLDNRIRFPVIRRTGKPRVELTVEQQSAVAELSKKIDSGVYTLIDNPCLCGFDGKDVLVAEEDQFGLPFEFAMCQRCSLIRTSKILDENSLNKFYKDDFGPTHRGGTLLEDFFLKQMKRGTWIVSLLDKHIRLDEAHSILEIGCAAGGNLYPFYKRGKSVSGFDYDEQYIEFGKDKGLNLRCGDYYANVDDESQDIVLLVHVLEHLADPMAEIVKAASKLRYGGCLYIEVPGVLYMSDSSFSPAKYFQHDHIFHYSKAYLELIFDNLGLRVLYGDEVSRFVVEKPEGWVVPVQYGMNNIDLVGNREKILRSIFWNHIYNDLLHLVKIRSYLVGVLDRLGIKEYVKRLVTGDDTNKNDDSEFEKLLVEYKRMR